MNRTDNPEAFDHLIDVLAARVLTEQHVAYRAQYPDSPHMHEYVTVNVHPRLKYTLVDVGPAHNMSGRYMVEHATGVIFGIKGYGVVHRGHRYGTLETIDEWAWGGYRAGHKVAS